MTDDQFNQIVTLLTGIRSEVDKHTKLFEVVLGIMKEMLANMTEEQGGDLADALRKLTEAINATRTDIAAAPEVIAGKLAPIIKDNHK